MATIVVFIACTASANQTRIVEGNYLRYEGTEYENVFFPCQNTEVWSLKGGKAFHALVDYHRNSRTSTYGEMKTSLELKVSPIDKTEHPGSHFDAVAKVAAIISISEDENEIISCRVHSP